jgi:integrase
MDSNGLSASRVRQAHQILRATLKQAQTDGLIGRNPAVGIDLPREHGREMLFLTPEQVRRLAELCDTRQPGSGALVLFLAWSGVRWSEVAALRGSSLSELNHSVVVKQAVTEVGGKLVWGRTKNHRSRAIVLARPVFELVSGERFRNAPEDLIFTAPRGGVLRSGNFRRTVWYPSVADMAATYPELRSLRIHDLRHTAASLAISADGNIKAIQRMLGHKHASVTLDRYGHLYDDDLVELARKMEEKYLAA